MEDEEDLLKELVSKLGRRRRQGADHDEIRSIDDERLHVSARLAALRSAKLAELKGERPVGGAPWLWRPAGATGGRVRGGGSLRAWVLESCVRRVECCCFVLLSCVLFTSSEL